jgi:hypothetical protein
MNQLKFMNEIEKTRDVFFTNFQRFFNFSEVTRETFKELRESGNEYGNFDLDYDIIDRWLDPVSYEWYYEKPPLFWYASALAAYFHCKNISFKTRLRLMRAANYYGDFDLVIQLASFCNGNANNAEAFFKIAQQEAKAFKNKGDFNKARVILRSLLSKSYLEKKEAHIAYFLMLYAKLCNDYQQRMGWHIAFHEISYNRMRAIFDKSSEQYRRAIRRWIEVCLDSYAKAIYHNDYKMGEKLYQKLLDNNKSHNDAYVRIRAHLLEARILKIIANNRPEDIDILEENLIGLYNLIRITEKLGNIRASNVRRIHFIQFAREIEEWRLTQRIKKRINIIQQLVDGEAILEAENVKNNSISISDWKTAAISAYEKSKWLKFSSGKQPGSGEVKSQKIIDSLYEVMKILTQESEELIPPIYHDVLMALAEAYVEMRKWDLASVYYNKSYKYCKYLIIELKNDEEEILNAIKNKKGEYNSDEIAEEFQVLEVKELENIREKLIVDYKVLVERLIDIGEHIHSLQFEQISKEIIRSKQLSRDFRYHDLASGLRHMQIKAKGQPEIHDALESFVIKLEEWAKKEPERVEPREMYISKKELENAINSDVKLEKYKQNIKLDGTDKQVFLVIFNEVLLHILLGTLIINVVESAQRNEITEHKIFIRIRDDNSIISLIIQDNTGDIFFFEKAINALNQNLPVPSRRGKNGGQGLKLIKELIKELTGLTQNWDLNRINNDTKEIIIPLARIVERKE